MRKKSIPFRKFTKSFPVFPIFSSIIFIYFTKKPQRLYRCGSFICKYRSYLPDIVVLSVPLRARSHTVNPYQIIRAKPFRPASAASDAAQNLVPSVPAAREKYRRAAHAPPR